MARAQEIATQIGSLEELLEIVAALRAIAAVQMQQSQRSLDAIREYSGIISRSLAEAASLVPEDGASSITGAAVRPGLVIFCSEHGFCGAFNQPLIKAAGDAIRSEPNLYLIFVGTRGAQRASEFGLEPAMTMPMATHSGGVTATARRVAAELYRMFTAQTLTKLEAIFTRDAAGQRANLVRSKLLPLEAPAFEEHPTGLSPVLNMEPHQLLDDLAAEYMFAVLEAAAMESFASENAARFRTMEAAHENIDNKTRELNRLVRRMRQEAVTTEILDLIGGFEALKRR